MTTPVTALAADLAEPDEKQRARWLLALTARLAGATDLDTIVATSADWPRAFGASSVALYLVVEQWVWRAHAAGLAPDDLARLDVALGSTGQTVPDLETTTAADAAQQAEAVAELLDRLACARTAVPLAGVSVANAGEAVLLPLREADTLIGVLVLLTAGQLWREQAAWWQSVAAHLAAALARAAALASARRRAGQVRLLAETGRAFAQLNVDEAVRRVVELTTELLGDGCWIAVRAIDEPESQPRIVSAYHRLPEKRALLAELVGSMVRPAEGLAGRVLVTGETALETVSPESPIAPERRQTVQLLGARRRLCVALRDREQTIGVLMCHATEPGTVLTLADTAIAEELARQAANAIENAWLYEQAQRREREAALLAEAGRLFNTSLALNEVLPWVVELAVEEVGDMACIYLRDEQEEQLTLAASSFANAELGALWRGDFEQTSRYTTTGVRGDVLRTGEAVLLPDALADSRVDPARVRNLRIGSWLVAPLLGQLGAIGVLTIATDRESRSRRPLDRGDLRLAEALAQRAATAIENARLYEQLRRREREAALLAEAGRRFNASLEVPTTLAAVVELAGRSLGHTCTLFLNQSGQDELALAAHYHPHPSERARRAQILREHLPRRGRGYIGRVAAGGPAVLVRDVRGDPAALQQPVERLGVHSWLCVPLRREDVVLGVLVVETLAPVRRFDEHDLALAEAIAARAAVAIENARLHEDRRRGELLQGAIAALAREVGSTLEPGDIARRLAAALPRHFDYATASVFLSARDRHEVVLRGFAARIQRQQPDDGSVRLRFGQGIVGWVAERNEPAVVSDVRLDDRYLVLGDRATVTTRSEIAVPIPGEHGPLGVINVESERLNAFDEDDLFMLRAVARQAAAALENATLHQQLAELAGTFRDLVEHSPDSFFVLDLTGRFLVVNEAICELTGYTAEELRAMRMTDLLAPEEHAAAQALVDQLIALEPSPAREWTVRRADGSERVFEIRARVLLEDSRPVALQGVGRDVTERRAQRRALEQRVGELTALHAAGLALAGTLEPTALQTALLDALRAAIPCDAITLYTVTDAGEGWVVPPAAQRQAEPGPLSFVRGEGLLGEVLERGEPLVLNDAPSDPRYERLPSHTRAKRLLIVPLRARGEARGCIVLRRKDGDPFTDDDRRLVESVAAQAAVTLQNAQLHAATLHAAAELRAVLESIEQGIVMTDAGGRIRFVNRRLGEFFGLDLGVAIGRHHLDIANQLLKPQTRAPELFLSRLVWLDSHPEESARDEIVLSRPATRMLERYSGPVRDTTTGELVGRIEVYADVTEARRLDRAKNEFLATASHELKTPITTLSGYLELLQRQVQRPAGPDLARVTRYVDTALGELDRLRRLNEDLLEVARIQVGRLALTPTATDLAALVAATVERFIRRPGLRERGHRLVCQASEPVFCDLDPLRLEQVCNNLIENALKYSPAGGDVVVTVERGGDEAVVSVRDSGIGVPPDDRERLFLPFYRAGNASAGSPEGLGLGLYISWSIVEGHGGRLSVEPAPGGGSIFRVALPLRQEVLGAGSTAYAVLPAPAGGTPQAGNVP